LLPNPVFSAENNVYMHTINAVKVCWRGRSRFQENIL